MELSYSFDGPTLLGTGGALKNALPLAGEKFLVLYGDSYLPIDYAAPIGAFAASGKLGLMTVFQNANRWDSSNVWFEDGEIKSYDKENRTPEMKHIDYGLGILRAEALAPWPNDRPFDLAEVYGRLSKQGELAGFEVHERFYEIGSHAGLRETEAYFSAKEQR